MTGARTTDPRLWVTLEQASKDIVGDWAQVREDAVSAAEVARYVEALTVAIRDSVDRPAVPAPLIPESILSRRLMALLRRGFLTGVGALSPPPACDALIVVLQAMIRVEDVLEPAWDRRFTDRLSGPDGLELVVELAHDLRSPLTSILFLAETMKRARSGPVTALQERQLGLVYSAAFGLSSVASDVIELARGGDRLVDLDPLPFSFTDVLESVRDIVQPIAEEKALEVRLVCPARPVRIGHPVALSRVLLNLTTNALKFTDTGYVEVCAIEGEGDLIEISVRDTGRGIPPQSMAMLFEPFRRRERDRDYALSGSGLGLSISRKLVEAMGADLKVSTEAGKGTRFCFTVALPLGQTAEHWPDGS